MTIHKLISDRTSIEAEIRYQLLPSDNINSEEAIATVNREVIISQESFKEGALSMLPFIEDISVKFYEWAWKEKYHRFSDREFNDGWMKPGYNHSFTTKELFELFFKQYQP